MPKSALTHSFSSIYFSDLLNSRVYLPSSDSYGILKDLLVQNDESARVLSCVVNVRRKGERVLDFSGFTISLEDREYQIICKEEIEGKNLEDAVSLRRHILDKQIVDINDKKVVRVNDVRLAFLASGGFPIAVDVGASGFFRRLGVIEIAQFVFRLFNRSVPSNLIRWRDIGVLSRYQGRIKLSVAEQKLLTLHPSDLSDIIEELDVYTGAAVFEALDHEKAADVLEELEDDAKVNLVEELSVEKVTEVFSKMPADEVADILDELDEDKVEELLSELDDDASSEIRELMQYAEGTAGSLMTTDFLVFPVDWTVGDVLEDLRRVKPGEDVINMIYVVDACNQLLGSVSLRDLLVSEPDTPLPYVMSDKPIVIQDSDKVESLAGVLSKYNLLAVPVINEKRKLLGAVVINDVIHGMLND